MDRWRSCVVFTAYVVAAVAVQVQGQQCTSLSQANLTTAIDSCSSSSYVNLTTYCDPNATLFCEPCHSLCSACFGPQPNQCYSCTSASGTVVNAGTNGVLSINGELIYNTSRSSLDCCQADNLWDTASQSCRTTSGQSFPLGAIIGIAVGGGVLALLLIALCVCALCCLVCRWRKKKTFTLMRSEESFSRDAVDGVSQPHTSINGSAPGRKPSGDKLSDLSKSPDSSNPLYLTSFDASVATFPFTKSHSSSNIRESVLSDAAGPYVTMESVGTILPGIVKSRSLGTLLDPVYAEPERHSATLLPTPDRKRLPMLPRRSPAVSAPMERGHVVKKPCTPPPSLSTSPPHSMPTDAFVNPRLFRDTLDRGLQDKDTTGPTYNLGPPVTSSRSPSPALRGSRQSPASIRSDREVLLDGSNNFTSREELLGLATEGGAAKPVDENYNKNETDSDSEGYVNTRRLSSSTDDYEPVDDLLKLTPKKADDAGMSTVRKRAEDSCTDDQDQYVEMKAGAGIDPHEEYVAMAPCHDDGSDDLYTEIGPPPAEGDSYVEMQPVEGPGPPIPKPHGYANLDYSEQGRQGRDERESSAGRDTGSLRSSTVSVPPRMSLSSSSKSRGAAKRDRVMAEMFFPPLSASSESGKKKKAEAKLPSSPSEVTPVANGHGGKGGGEEGGADEVEEERLYQNVEEWAGN